ncbi:MAG TPA: EVE domain-containing protein [Thermoanaerobaculia bacterium]|jgi:hypothetical protein|nr:EVE domain-containing protein [Thermoanaerobaculia bacterium]
MRYWLNTVSRDHVQRAVAGGFTQADHGKATRLRQLARGDLLAFYSPRTHYPDGEPLRVFTALGRIADEAPFQVEMTPTFHPWRRKVEFLPAREAPIAPLLPDLDFIANKAAWGMYFRRGLFAVGAEDFARIAAAMGIALPS